ncbi:MAG: hypothetical protein IJV03_04170 [Alphaproteobacteria bacterium]|nr:hypothetical protein [Alphaproteobacteria bacterium]
MILQKSARFLMIFLCAIMFHGNVFGESSDKCYKGTHETGYGFEVNNTCVMCSGGYYAKLNSEETKYECVLESECSGNDYCKRVVNSSNTLSKRYECQSTGIYYLRQADGNCLDIKKCGYEYEEGYGITFGEDGYVESCGVCAEGKSPQLDDSGVYEGVYVCKEIDQCASDTSCLTAGCGKVDGQCQQCSGDKPYSLKISGVSVPYNICVPNIAEENSDAATCYENNKGCVCKSGFGAQDYTAATMFTPEQPGGCSACGENYITADNTCVGCIGGQVAEDNKCVCPGENQTFNETKLQCVCADGYGLDGNNVCTELGDGQIVNDVSGKIENCGFGRVPHTDKNRCVTCTSPNIANENQTACVTTCEGQGYGKHTENGYSQCVVCSEQTNANGGQMLENNGVCVDGCGKYQENNNGTCNYCDTNQFYDFDTKTCVNTCDNSYPVSDENTNVNVCCGEYQYFDDSAKECKSCESNQWFEERTCQSCPKNFACNGKTKIKCPFGTKNDQKLDGTFTNSCVSLDISNSNTT